MKKILTIFLCLLLTIGLTGCKKEEAITKKDKDKTQTHHKSYFNKKKKEEIKEVKENTQEIPDGYTVFILDVDFNSTFGNSILPGNMVDIYVSINDENISGQYILFNDIKVLSVLDAYGNEAANSLNEPNKMTLMVKENEYPLLSKAFKISSVKPILVPSNNKIDIVDENIKNYILNY